mmetsp:Transcript_37309/g.37993  ORF Transcript_37309/g.37993 Transcript_37309/m.37993 type:complete len:403 (-) Transcript_37309:223-1431(-)
MGGGISSTLQAARLSLKAQRKTPGVNDATKFTKWKSRTRIEKFVDIAFTQGRRESFIKFILKDPMANQNFVRFLLQNFPDRALCALNISDMQQRRKSDILLIALQAELERSCFSKRTATCNHLLEELVLEGFPIFLKSSNYREWRHLEVERRRSWLIQAHERLVHTTLPEMIPVMSSVKDLYNAEASIHRQKLVLTSEVYYINSEASSPSSPYSSPSHSKVSKSLSHSPHLHALPVDTSFNGVMQEAINNCDELDLKCFLQHKSWLSEFVLAAHHLPLSISIFRPLHERDRYPCVYANKCYEELLGLPIDRLIGKHMGCIDEYVGTNQFISALQRAITEKRSAIAVIECDEATHVIGMKPVLDNDLICKYIICIYRPCIGSINKTCDETDVLFHALPADMMH